MTDEIKDALELEQMLFEHLGCPTRWGNWQALSLDGKQQRIRRWCLWQLRHLSIIEKSL